LICSHKIFSNKNSATFHENAVFALSEKETPNGTLNEELSKYGHRYRNTLLVALFIFCGFNLILVNY